jgi:hypothetical protein
MRIDVVVCRANGRGCTIVDAIRSDPQIIAYCSPKQGKAALALKHIVAGHIVVQAPRLEVEPRSTCDMPVANPWFIFPCALILATHALAQAVPMPPTNVRVEETPSVLLVDRIFLRQGIDKAIRSFIYAELNKLHDSDLLALSKSFDPGQLGVTKPDAIEEDQWKQLVSAYSEAIRADRGEKKSLYTQISMTVGGTLLGTLAGVMGGMWLERRKIRPSGQAALSPVAPSSNSGRKRKRNRRR